MKTRLRAASLAGAVALLLVAGGGVVAAGGGTITGTIRAGESPGTPIADAVVMIDGPSVLAAAGAPHAVINQLHDSFVPPVLAVTVGTTVDFPNSDPRLHNVFSTSAAKKFDLGMYEQGEVKSVIFDTPGVVEMRCKVHPKMKGFIVVHSNPYVAVSNEQQGSYTIADVPPGTYTLRVWHENLPEEKVPVTIGEGQVRALDVRLKEPR
jgi:plastocyanin